MTGEGDSARMPQEECVRPNHSTGELDAMPTRIVRKNRSNLFLFLPILLGGIAAACPVRGQGDAGLARYDVAIRPISLIPPGTVIENKAPSPYTHLIVKSYPRLGAGDLHAVNGTTKELASFLHTSLLARIGTVGVNGQQRYRLEDVATGFGTNIRSRGDAIISPETQQQLGADLGFLARLVLQKCYEEQQKCRYVVRSDTMAIVDTPVIMRRGDVNRKIVIRYAFLVSERSGRLDTLLWMIDTDRQGRYMGVAGEIQWLAPNKIVDCVMHVDAREFTLGVPSDVAFACVKEPQGERSLAVPEGFVPLAAAPQFTKEQARSAEIWLWGLLQQLAARR